MRYVYRGHEFDAANEDDAHDTMNLWDAIEQERAARLSFWERALSSGKSEGSAFLPTGKLERKRRARELIVGIVLVASILIALFLFADNSRRGSCRSTDEGCEIQAE
jgi:hypothetical protein